MIKVVIDKPDSKVVRRQNIHVYDEAGNELKGITRIALELNCISPAKLTIETFDFEFEGKFSKDEVEIMTKKVNDEDTSRV